MALKKFEEYIYSLTPGIRKPLYSVTKEEIIGYRNYCIDVKGIKPSSMDTYMRTLSNFYSYLTVDRGLISENPILSLDKIKVPEKLPVYLTDEEIERFFSVASNARENAMAKTLYYSGLRIGELVSIKRKDIDFEGRKIRVMAKGRIEREQPMPTQLVKALYDYCSAFAAEQRVFNVTTATIEKDVKIMARKANIAKWVTPHTLRHSYGRFLRKQGVDLIKIQQLLGHKSLSTTEVYLKLEDENLNDTVDIAFKEH